jgi:hypothetical protein
MDKHQLYCLSVFESLLDTPVILSLLQRQPDLDKFSLAACFVYFLRAKLDPKEYSGRHLAICMYIDNLIQVCQS